MSKDNDAFYNQVSKEIKKWIDAKYPKDRKIKEPGTRGPATRFTNNDLVEIALEVKKSLRGEKINPNKLESITGIGRQTWNRRINNDLVRLNTPVIEGRELGIEEDDEIYHVNIAYIVEKYGKKPKELINQLYLLEETRYKLFAQVKKLKKELQSHQKYKEENEQLVEENKYLKEIAAHYESLYYNSVVSSWYPEMRKKNNIDKNLIDLNSDPEKNTKIVNLQTFFPTSKEVAATSDSGKKERLKNAGEELIDELTNEFNDLLDD
jgi:regulator of replication initiation timing